MLSWSRRLWSLAAFLLHSKGQRFSDPSKCFDALNHDERYWAHHEGASLLQLLSGISICTRFLNHCHSFEATLFCPFQQQYYILTRSFSQDLALWPQGYRLRFDRTSPIPWAGTYHHAWRHQTSRKFSQYYREQLFPILLFRSKPSISGRSSSSFLFQDRIHWFFALLKIVYWTLW